MTKFDNPTKVLVHSVAEEGQAGSDRFFGALSQLIGRNNLDRWIIESGYPTGERYGNGEEMSDNLKRYLYFRYVDPPRYEKGGALDRGREVLAAAESLSSKDVVVYAGENGLYIQSKRPLSTDSIARLAQNEAGVIERALRGFEGVSKAVEEADRLGYDLRVDVADRGAAVVFTLVSVDRRDSDKDVHDITFAL